MLLLDQWEKGNGPLFAETGGMHMLAGNAEQLGALRTHSLFGSEELPRLVLVSQHLRASLAAVATAGALNHLPIFERLTQALGVRP